MRRIALSQPENEKFSRSDKTAFINYAGLLMFATHILKQKLNKK